MNNSPENQTKTDGCGSLPLATGSAPTFDELCHDLSVTREEREALAHHLAGIRYRETLKLVEHPITRAALASAHFARDGKVSVVRGKHLIRVKPNTPSQTTQPQSPEHQ